MFEGKTVHVHDVQSDPDYNLSGVIALGGYRSTLGVPLLREGNPIGVLFLSRTRVEPFTQQQIDLVATFADQAVIAIENVRLFEDVQKRTRELQESLEFQTATSEILTVISRSPTDAQPVFEIIGERAEKLCNAEISVVSMVDGDVIELASIHGVNDDGVAAVKRAFRWPSAMKPLPRARSALMSSPMSRTCLKIIKYENKQVAVTAGYRGCLGVPMVREGQVIGAIFVARTEPGLFTDTQVQLLKTFADQAVIAIENVRLFEAEQARTHELTESLQQQTATADVLKAISRSTFDLETVLNTLLESATRLCEGHISWIFQSDGEILRWAASYGHTPEAHASVRDYFKPLEIPVNRGSVVGRAAFEGAVVHIPDVLADRRIHLERRSKDRRLSLGPRCAAVARGEGRRRAIRRENGPAAVYRQADRAGDRTSPTRPSSPSRTRGCSTSCASAPTI